MAEMFLTYGWGIRCLVVYHMLPKCLLFIFRRPFIRPNMRPLTISTLRFSGFFVRTSFVGMNLTADQAFCFDLQLFAEWPKLWQ